MPEPLASSAPVQIPEISSSRVRSVQPPVGVVRNPAKPRTSRAPRPAPGQRDRGYRSAMPDRPDAARDADAERWLDLDVKLAYQERLIRELDALVREFGARLDKAERELAQLRQAMPPPLPLGPINEPPPHY